MKTPIITVLTSQQPTGKSYSLVDGELKKGNTANSAKGRAFGAEVNTAEELAGLLRELTSAPNLVPIPGAFVGSKVDEHFDIVYEAELRELLGPKHGAEGKKVDGLWDIKGRPVPVAARLKDSVEPCAWQVLDFDKPPGMPPEFADLDIPGRLALLEKVVPGISTCERVEVRSSTARVVPPGGAPKAASHAWVRFNDPTLAETLRQHIHVEAPLQGLSFLSPHRSKATGEIVKHVHLTLFDLAVLIRGRIVFCSAPTISPDMVEAGWKVADAGVTIVNPGGGELDISGIARPAAERLAAYAKVTGEHLTISGKGTSFAIESRGMLKLETPIETKHTPVSTFGEAWEWLKGQPKGKKLRCQAPFRVSDTEAAFIRIGDSGEPFLHDSATATSYRLAHEMPDMSRLAAVLKGVPTPVGGEDAIALSPPAHGDQEQKNTLAARYEALLTEKGDLVQLLAWAFDAVPLNASMLPNPDLTQGDKVSIKQAVTAARVHKVMDLVDMTVRQNVMTGDIECRFGALVFKEKDSQKAIEAFMHACVRCGMNAADRIIKIVLLRAVENRYSPVGEWIESKPWDGRSRMQDLCNTLTMRVPANNPWRDIVVRKWCKQVIAAIRNWELDSPTEIGQVLVLQGSNQGEEKSKWIKGLLPAPWVMTGATLRLDSLNERDVVSRVTETAITELGELDNSFSKSATGALKNFITSPVDKYRPPYGTKLVARPRCTALAATLNPGGFLVDPSGARRYWPLAVTHCLVEHGIDMQQLWAEVWVLEEENGMFWLNDAEKLMHAAITEGHQAPTDVNFILDDLKYRAGIYDLNEYVHANARELWSWYLKTPRLANTMAYSDLNTGLEAAGYRGARVKGKQGYWVPKYTNTITKELEDALKRKAFTAIKGGKGDD
jgi:hypothetical protein